MPKKPKEKTVTKLVNYIKKDRPKKFRACVKKYDVDLQSTSLPKGRTLLHCASKHGCGYFIGYMLAHGVLASQADNKGDLPLHLALDRALQLQPDQAAEVYNDVVVPLLKNYPDALYFCDHRGTSVSQLLSMLNRHLLSAEESDSDSSDSEWSDSESSCSSFEGWSERLAREFESESADFYGRYNFNEDFTQESQKETYNDWAERMGRDMRKKHQYQFYGSSQTSGKRKRQDSSSEHAGARPKPPKSKPGINTKAEINKAKSLQNMDRLRKMYEERFQAVLKDKSGKKLSFGDIPWPSRGSLESVDEVLFGDKSDWSIPALKKYVREQQVRWHPDKFLQKFIDKITPKSFEKVMERVKEISQALNKKAEALSSGER